MTDPTALPTPLDGPTCPQCGALVERDWHWCRHCGFDPEGLRALLEPDAPGGGPPRYARKAPVPPPARPPTMARTRRRWGTREVALAAVLVALVVGGVAVFQSSNGSEPTRPAPGTVPATAAVGPKATSPPSSAPVPAAAADWTRFSAPDGAFSVEFPGPASTATDRRQVDGRPADVTTYAASTGTMRVSVAVYRINAFGLDVARAASAVVADLATTTKGSVVRSTPRSQGDRGADFQVSGPGGPRQGTVRFVSGAIYVLLYEAPTLDPKTWERFQASLRVPA